MDIDVLEVLKWIGIVLAAGFVGYFGRYLAMLIIARLRKKEETAGAPPSTGEVKPPGAASLKLEKKRAKQAAKQAKKATKKP
jgi:hypothetical protein